MSSPDIETEEAFYERVQEECREKGHQWIERKDAPTESLSPFLAAKLQALMPPPPGSPESIYGRVCKHCGEYGLECVSCDKGPEELEDHFLSLQSYGQCYDCRAGNDDDNLDDDDGPEPDYEEDEAEDDSEGEEGAESA